MSNMPHDSWPDSTIPFLYEGNRFINNRCNKFNSSVFTARLLFRPTICMRGREEAALFYDKSKFARKGAAPKRLQRTLIGRGGVQGLDGAAHQSRKSAFMSLMSEANINRLVGIFEKLWLDSAKEWQNAEEISLYNTTNQICFEAACLWSGIDLARTDSQKRTAEMVAMIEAPAAIGPRYIKGILARKSAEHWAKHLVRDARRSSDYSDPREALYVIGTLKGEGGRYIDEHSAAVDLLNIIRPIVAIGRYICFAALSLYKFPDCRKQLETGDQDDFVNFTQEVRRYYPYFPFAAAVTKDDFSWRGYRFKKGTLVLLDLFGTTHDDQLWDAPEAFNPNRFKTKQDEKFTFIPQGGGVYETNHRCAGEWITIEIVKSALNMLIFAMSYKVPEQDLSIDYRKMPTLPKSGFVITDIKFNRYTAAPANNDTTKSVNPHTNIDMHEAKAGSPANNAVCGEEDPGAGLEAFVNEIKKDTRR